jgi:hypothetical protein
MIKSSEALNQAAVEIFKDAKRFAYPTTGICDAVYTALDRVNYHGLYVDDRHEDIMEYVKPYTRTGNPKKDTFWFGSIYAAGTPEKIRAYQEHRIIVCLMAALDAEAAGD